MNPTPEIWRVLVGVSYPTDRREALYLDEGDTYFLAYQSGQTSPATRAADGLRRLEARRILLSTEPAVPALTPLPR